MKNLELQAHNLDTATLMNQIRERVINKSKNNEYQSDLKLINSLGSAEKIETSLNESFFLLDNLKTLTTSKKGILGRFVKFIAKRIYWIIHNSLASIFTIQQDFNKYSDNKLKELEARILELEKQLSKKI